MIKLVTQMTTDGPEHWFTCLNDKQDGTEEHYERIDLDAPVGEGFDYDLDSFYEGWEDEIKRFKLEFEYE